MAAKAVGELGARAAPAKPALIELVQAADDGWLQETAIDSLRRIGIDGTDAKALAQARVRDDSDGTREIFRELVRRYPDLAGAFVAAHPRLLSSMPANDLALIDLFARNDAASSGLRDFLSRRADLPQFVRVNYAKGERVGHVMTWPRKPDPRECFPQHPAVVRVEPGRVALERFAEAPDRRLWDAEGLVLFSVGDRWGFADAATGRIAIEPRFDWAQNFSGGRAVVVLADKHGYVDRAGRLVVPPRFEWGYAFSKGAAAVQQDGKYGLIASDGSWIKEPTYKRIEPYGDGWRATAVDGTEGMLDAKGNLILPVTPKNSHGTTRG